MQTKTIPNQWKTSDIILIHKKGRQSDINNYRPISLAPSVGKVFAKALETRIKRSLDIQQPTEQAGFRSGFSTIDHIHSIGQVIEKAKEYQKIIYMAFIDYKKAFDCVSHSFLVKSLHNQGVDSNAIEVIKAWYKDSNSRIVMDRAGSDFNIERGVKQGDPLSPILFNCILEEVFRNIIWDRVGIKINGVYLSNLRFADDVVLFSESSGQLQNMIKELSTNGIQAGLTINKEKTFLMTNAQQTEDIFLDGAKLKWVESTEYLGKLISFEDGNLKEVNRRIAISWKKYWALKFIFKSSMNIELKARVMNSCILPCMIYGSQTWTLTKRITNRLRVTQYAMERSMLGIRKSDKIRNAEIRRKTGVQDVTAAALKQKWTWAGHLARMEEGRWARRTTDWIPLDCTRRRGRPCQRWRDDMDKFCGTLWWRAAQDRTIWKNLGEAFAQKWAK